MVKRKLMSVNWNLGMKRVRGLQQLPIESVFGLSKQSLTLSSLQYFLLPILNHSQSPSSTM